MYHVSRCVAHVKHSSAGVVVVCGRSRLSENDTNMAVNICRVFLNRGLVSWGMYDSYECDSMRGVQLCHLPRSKLCAQLLTGGQRCN